MAATVSTRSKENLAAGASYEAASEPSPSSPLAENVDGDRSNNKLKGNALDLASIAPMLNAGFRAVLEEASKRGVLDPPHGRTPMPDPKKITEDDPFMIPSDDEEGGRGEVKEQEEVVAKATAAGAATGTVPPCRGGVGNLVNDNKSNDDDDDDDDDRLLEYKFDYGFNPLVFLGEYLRRNNPAAIRARKNQHDADLEYLRRRAAKSLEREAALGELRALVANRRSGVIHGPVVGEVSDCGCIMWARTFRSGTA